MTRTTVNRHASGLRANATWDVTTHVDRRVPVSAVMAVVGMLALLAAVARFAPAASPALAAPVVPDAPSAETQAGVSGAPFTQPLYQPPVLTGADLNINMQESCVQILAGACTNMWTYNGTFPGPTIRRPTGQTTTVQFTNNLPPAAGSMTVHNHGNHSTSHDDGHPDMHLIDTGGGAYTYTYDHEEDGANERGATQFYHDHRMDVTGRNVWMGLVGFYIIDDPADPASLPSGAFDVPLMISNRTFNASNQISYTFNRQGVAGITHLVNGRPQPYMEVGDRKYRFRILNASNSSMYFFALSNDQVMTQIGTESGLLPAPVGRTELRASPAERMDIVIDFSGMVGQTIYLMDTLRDEQLMEIRVTQDVTDNSSVPTTLRPLPNIGTPTTTRNFAFDEAGGHWTINGQMFDMDRFDAEPLLGSTETWVFQHPGGGAIHAVHIHGVDAQCVSRNFLPCAPYETMKETWFLGSGERLELKLKFSDHLGAFIFHCHLLEHEDDGMMSQFNVVAPPATPTPTPTPGPPTATPTPSPTKTPVPGDSDLDGCTNVQEQGAMHELGGQRDPNNFWDFYDVTHDRGVDLSDALEILGHFGHAHSEDPLDPLLDRDIPNLTFFWRTAAAADGIDLTDALNNLYSFGDGCG